MATSTQINNFINEIAPYAQEAYKTLGKVLPSVCIGMACIESAYGTSRIMRNHNAYFGQKVGSGKTATRYWSGKFFTSKTSEEYTVGSHTIIKAAFRAYDSMKQSVFNYYELLNTKLYSRVMSGVDYRTQMQQIKACGYMTSSTEVNSVINLIQRYNLTRFDSATSNTRPTLKKGSKSDAVKALQIFLNLNGYQCGSADGIFGSKTETAVRAFQKAHPECGTADGIVGKKTWQVIDDLLS